MTKERKKAAESLTLDPTKTTESPTPIVDASEEIERIKAEHKEEKKKRRKSKKKDELEESLKSDVVLFSDVLCHVLDTYVRRMPNPLELTRTEKTLFIDSSNKLLSKYIPKVSEWKEEIGFVTVMFVLILPRMKKKSDSIPAEKNEEKNDSSVT